MFRFFLERNKTEQNSKDLNRMLQPQTWCWVSSISFHLSSFKVFQSVMRSLWTEINIFLHIFCFNSSFNNYGGLHSNTSQSPWFNVRAAGKIPGRCGLMSVCIEIFTDRWCNSNSIQIQQDEPLPTLLATAHLRVRTTFGFHLLRLCLQLCTMQQLTQQQRMNRLWGGERGRKHRFAQMQFWEHKKILLCWSLVTCQCKRTECPGNLPLLVRSYTLVSVVDGMCCGAGLRCTTRQLPPTL